MRSNVGQVVRMLDQQYEEVCNQLGGDFSYVAKLRVSGAGDTLVMEVTARNGDNWLTYVASWPIPEMQPVHVVAAVRLRYPNVLVTQEVRKLYV